MSQFFSASWMLVGLAAVSIPVIIHLLNRRRFEIVDWGAMQFLQVSETVRRRLMIEDVLLMLLRMGLIGVMVLGMATPLLPGVFWAWLGAYVPAASAQHVVLRPNRDLVLVIDGSARMSYTETGPTTADAARAWATAFLGDLAPGDSVAVIDAREKPVRVVGAPTVDHDAVRQKVEKMLPPSGGCDWAEAVNEAITILEGGRHSHRDVFLIGDGSTQGLADPASLSAWHDKVAPHLKKLRDRAPRLTYVNVAPERAADPPNWTLSPLRSNRAVAAVEDEVTFRSDFQLANQTTYQRPHRLRVEVDGQEVAKPIVNLPESAKLEKGQVKFDFSYKFKTPGVHLLSAIVEPDPPGEHVKDRVSADNRQDLAIEVVAAYPVLLVDGDPRESAPGLTRFLGAEFLQSALAPANDPTPTVALRMVGYAQFKPALLTEVVSKESGAKPRVLILANVARLTTEQQEAIVRFLNDGGGVLVAAGNRADPRFYTDQLYRGGAGWLPAGLADVVNNEGNAAMAAVPQTKEFAHPTLEIFERWRKENKGDLLSEVRFPRWWKLSSKTGTPILKLTDTDPFLIEKAYGKGRVILSAVPLDNTWGTNLTSVADGGAFVTLAQQLVSYLAGGRAADYNLKPTQPILYRPLGGLGAAAVVVQPPTGEVQPLSGDRLPLTFDGTRQTGVYRVEEGGRPTYYVVQPQGQPSLALLGEADRSGLEKQVKMTFESDRNKLALPSSEQPTQLWWPLLVGVIFFLCGEVWMTRRIALSR